MRRAWLLAGGASVGAVALVAAVAVQATSASRIALEDETVELGADASIEFGADASVGFDAPGGPDAWIGLDAWIGVDAPIGIDGSLPFCPIETLAPESLGDGEFEYPGDLIGCDDPEARAVAHFTARADGPKKLDNKVKDRETIAETKKNERRHAELVEANRERITRVLEAPAREMPPPGARNPLGVTFERFKLAVEGNGSGERVALHFEATPAGGGEPARTAKENQDKMGAELREAMAAINQRLQRAGVEALGEYQFVIIGSGTTFYSNNHNKNFGGEPKVFGQKTTGTPPNEKNESGTRQDIDIDIHLRCPSMVSYMADRPHVLNKDATRMVDADVAIYNLFRSSDAKGLYEYFPEIKEVATRWKDKLDIKEVELKLTTELEIKEVGPGPGPILLTGGP